MKDGCEIHSLSVRGKYVSWMWECVLKVIYRIKKFAREIVKNVLCEIMWMNNLPLEWKKCSIYKLKNIEKEMIKINFKYLFILILYHKLFCLSIKINKMLKLTNQY